MRIKITKRILSALVIGSMLITSSNLAYASAGGSDQSSSTGKEDSSGTETKSEENVVASIISETENITNSTVAGLGKSSVDGVYAAKSVNGTAIVASSATVNSKLGLGGNEKAYVTTWDITAKNSPKAYASLQAGAASVGGALGPMVQVNLNKMSNGKLVSLEGNEGKVEMAFGIPASFRNKGEYAMVHVVAGGKIEILKDLDNNPNTITVNVSAGNGAYAIVAY